jgi:hypothetical protein
MTKQDLIRMLKSIRNGMLTLTAILFVLMWASKEKPSEDTKSAAHLVLIIAATAWFAKQGLEES